LQKPDKGWRINAMAVKVAAIAVLILSLAPLAGAQSLGDVAKAEEARRKAVKAPGKVYTNGSLKTEPPPSPGLVTPPPDAKAAAGAPAPGAGTPNPAAGAGAPAAGDNAPKDEAYWRKRIEAERTALARAQTFIEALQSRIDALSTDFVNRDDPQQRSAIAADRQKALAELDRVKQEIDDHQKAITTIQDDARKAGAPAGWVR
jgi:hypothetical protein